MKTLSIAHRGASGHFPENTLLAFEKAVKSNCDGIELDVHLSADGQIVVFHDDSVLYNNKKTLVSEFSFAEIRTIALPEKQFIPLLPEVVDLIDKKCFVNIELKGNNTPKAVVEIIDLYIKDKKWTYNHFLISSFSKDLLLETKFLNPEIRLAILTDSDLELAFDFAKYLKLHAINPQFHLLTENDLQRMHFAGFKVFAWTANEKNDIKNLIDMGIDGIISDFPEHI